MGHELSSASQSPTHALLVRHEALVLRVDVRCCNLLWSYTMRQLLPEALDSCAAGSEFES